MSAPPMRAALATRASSRCRTPSSRCRSRSAPPRSPGATARSPSRSRASRSSSSPSPPRAPPRWRFNRVADRRFDAANPRTATRELPRGAVSLASAVAITVGAAVVFVAAAALLGRWPLLLVADRALHPPRLLARQALHLGHAPVARRLRSAARRPAPGSPSPTASAWAPLALSPRRRLLGRRLRHHLLHAGRRLRSRRAARLDPGALRRRPRARHLARCCTSAPSPASSPSASLLHLGVVYGLGVAVIAGTLAYEQRIVSPDDLSRVEQGLLRSQRLGQPRLRRLRHRRGAAMIVLLRAGASRAEARAVEAELARAGASAPHACAAPAALAVEVVGPHAPFDDATRRAPRAPSTPSRRVLARRRARTRASPPRAAPSPSPRRSARSPSAATSGRSCSAPAPSRTRPISSPPPPPPAPPARASSAAAPSSRAPRPTPSRASATTACRCSAASPTRSASPSSARRPSEASVARVAELCELIQIGARTMAATSLLKAAARAGRPVLLKRGFGATVDEWLAAAEYLLDGGAPGVILCERGIRSFEPGTRATLDLGGLALAKLRTGLPVVADPSHAAGTRALVAAAGPRRARRRRRRAHRRVPRRARPRALRRPAGADARRRRRARPRRRAPRARARPPRADAKAAIMHERMPTTQTTTSAPRSSASPR